MNRRDFITTAVAGAVVAALPAAETWTTWKAPAKTAPVRVVSRGEIGRYHGVTFISTPRIQNPPRLKHRALQHVEHGPDGFVFVREASDDWSSV